MIKIADFLNREVIYKLDEYDEELLKLIIHTANEVKLGICDKDKLISLLGTIRGYYLSRVIFRFGIIDGISQAGRIYSYHIETTNLERKEEEYIKAYDDLDIHLYFKEMILKCIYSPDNDEQKWIADQHTVGAMGPGDRFPIA